MEIKTVQDLLNFLKEHETEDNYNPTNFTNEDDLDFFIYRILKHGNELDFDTFYKLQKLSLMLSLNKKLELLNIDD